MVRIKYIVRDGERVIKAKCPNCGRWADCDKDQAEGKVSLICPYCEWHGNVND